MLNSQLWLFPDMGEIKPCPRQHFPDEAIPALKLLFYQGVEAPRTGPNCPYRSEMGLACDCQTALVLVCQLGKNQPACSRYRCPVRQILAKVLA